MYQLPITTAGFEKYYKIGETGCWEWKGWKSDKGYGMLRLDGRPRSAHTVSYMLYKGFYPYGLVVRHRCDNPGCVNPEHLELGTMADNCKDRDSRGRGAYGKRNKFRQFHPKMGNLIIAMLNEGTTKTDLAEFFQVSAAVIGRIARGDHWLAEYIDRY